jgi:hypothetical protein
MRYRLRTLLILVTAVGMLLGWIAWLRHTAAFHRQESVRLAGMIAAIEGNPVDNVEERIRGLSAGGSVTKWVRAANGEGETCTLLRNGRYTTYSDSATVDIEDWSKAVYQAMMGDRFDRALYRPWTLWTENAPTAQNMYVPLSDDKAWSGIARPPMVELKE